MGRERRVSTKTGLRYSRAEITEAPIFFRRIENTGVAVCEKCLPHQYIIVVKLTTGYHMHSHVRLNVRTFKPMHTWRNRLADPPCLAAYEPFRPVSVRARQQSPEGSTLESEVTDEIALILSHAGSSPGDTTHITGI